MGWKLSGSLIHCTRCGKPGGLFHTCVVKRAGGRQRWKPQASVTTKCGKCGKTYSNPLTHTCVIKTDWKKRRKAAAAKPKRAQHSYSACRDGDCERMGCVAYKEGLEDGYEDGFADGVASGSRR